MEQYSVPKEVWLERMDNLNERRKTEVIRSTYPIVDDYEGHIKKCLIGKNVLDVGCGLQIIKQFLPDDVTYMGIDSFPMVEGTYKYEIEEFGEENGYLENTFDTVYAFAVLDNLRDLKLGIDNMKRICSKNIVILTGIDCRVDQFHTFSISEAMLSELMEGFTVGYKEWLVSNESIKILLIEYLKP